MADKQSTSPQVGKKVSVILEVKAASYQHLVAICSPDRGRSMKQVLELQEFGGSDVIWASHPHIPEPTEICKVPHFGHSTSCEKPCTGGGVYRLFEVEVLVEPDAKKDVMGRYDVGGYIEIDVCGLQDIVDVDEVLDSPSDSVGRLFRDYDTKGHESADKRIDIRRSSMGVGATESYQSTI